MKYFIIVLNSVTSAKRIEKIALKEGILCNIIHTPKVISRFGCSHSVRVEERYAKRIVEIANNMDIAYQNIYSELCERGECRYKEIKL